MWEIEKHKKKRRHYGWFLKNTTTNMRIYVARRFHHEIFRSGELTVSEAQRKNIACWALDVETLTLAKIKGVTLIAVKVRDDGSIYLTQIENFYDPAHTSIKNYTARGGALQKYLPLDQFRVLHKVKI